MNSLFNPSDVPAIIDRVNKLTSESPRQWGKMNVAQMLAHCNISVETAMGLNNLPRVFIGRIIAPFFRKSALSEKPFGKNSPTDKSYIFPVDLDFNEQRAKAIATIQKFSDGGTSQCTTYPHPFFGKFTPEEWGVFQWKHLDHHLRQFGV